MTEQNNEVSRLAERKNAMEFSKHAFAKLAVNDLSNGRNVGRSLLKTYKQSEVREIIENYKLEKNQIKLREISRLLFVKSPQYQRLISYLSGMALFAHAITPIKEIRKLNKPKVLKQYTEIGELVKMMNLPHEMRKVLNTSLKEDVFYGYIHRDKKSFYIQHIDADICKITSIEDGIFNFSIDMRYFEKDELRLNAYAKDIKAKYIMWKTAKNKNPKISEWVELEAEKTICIKANEEMLEIFPPFAGGFDAIFDIEGFKQLRKDKEELSNYMILTQELPIRKDSESNNDFMIDQDTMMYFHNQAIDAVPENVGVITSPMKIEPVKFEKDRADMDGVAKAERDLWNGWGVSQLLFNADKNTSEGLLKSIKSDEQIVFALLTQIERWLNRYLKDEFADLMFKVSILHITQYNQKEKFDMYLQAGQFGTPVKSLMCATLGIDPIETMNLAYLENDLLKMHEEFIPLMSSHTMGEDALPQNGGQKDGRPKKKEGLSDEGARSQDKPNK